MIDIAWIKAQQARVALHHPTTDFTVLHGEGVELLALAARTVEAEAQATELRFEVREWLCVKCNTVFPGPPQESVMCVVCPLCEGTTAPRTTIERRKSESSRDRLAKALEIAEIGLRGIHLIDRIGGETGPSRCAGETLAAIASAKGDQP